jgi:23S rRNA (adenine2503-C2)-methyltransferase
MLSFTRSQFANHVLRHLGKGERHASLIYSEWMRTGRIEAKGPAFKNAEALKEQILALCDFSMPTLVEEKREGETVKFLTQTEDELLIESVLIPMNSGWTLCVSSQVGCRMGCAFCETGKMGLVRSLSVAEIVAQLWIARHLMKFDVRSVVFMGMGEPLDNFDAVMGAVQVMIDEGGLALGARHITISTCGRVPEIYRLIEEAPPSLKLAVSVNAQNDEVRRKIMPVNRDWQMEELRQAMLAWCATARREVFVEYVLIAGVNDDAADELADYLEGVPCKVNLIPYNPMRRGPFAAPSDEVVERFWQRLKQRGLHVFVRGTKGQKIMAACGQLGGKRNLKCASVWGYETCSPPDQTHH